MKPMVLNIGTLNAQTIQGMRVVGQTAQARMDPACGNGSFRTFLLDALYNLNGDILEQKALVEEI